MIRPCTWQALPHLRLIWAAGNADRDKCIQLLAEALQPALRPEAIAQQLEAALLKCCAPDGTPSLRYKQRLRSLWPILQHQPDDPASPVRQALLRGELSTGALLVLCSDLSLPPTKKNGELPHALAHRALTYKQASTDTVTCSIRADAVPILPAA